MIIKDDPNELITYQEDTSNLKGSARKLYIPENIDELRALVRQCVTNVMPLTVVSGHTGTTGGCIALSGAVVSMEKFNKIRGVDVKKFTIDLETGVSLKSLAAEASRHGLRFAAASTEELSFIGGAISTCASGVRGVGYGSIRNYVLAIEVMLANGDLIKIERGKIFASKRKFDFTLDNRRFEFFLPDYKMPKVKHQAGYFVKDNMDLIDLFIGMEGTLGIITAARIQLTPEAPAFLDGLIFFDAEDKALNFAAAVRELKRKNSLKPISLEYFDSQSLIFLRPKNNFIPKQAQAAIYFEHEAPDQNGSGLLQDEFFALALWHKAMLDDSILATNESERKRIFDFRHSLPQAINEFLRSVKQVKIASDIAVGEGHFETMYQYYLDTAKASGLTYVNFGHIGECHLHFNFLPRNEAEQEKAKKLIMDLCRMAVKLGGTVSAEHGIGKIKKDYLKLLYKPQDIAQMAAVKKYFDPACILGLDNIFEKELLR